MTKSLTCASIDDYLGAADHRFFGLGYRRVFYDASELVLTLSPVANLRPSLNARLSVVYPHDWSLKKGADQRPHLSSVDLLILCPQFGEVFLTHALRLTETERQQLWLKSIKLKPGMTAQEDLIDLPVQLTLVRTTPSDHHTDRAVSVFDCRIAKMQARCEIEHPNRPLRPESGHYASPAQCLGAEETRYYGAAFKQRGQRITDVVHEGQPALHATALVEIRLDPTNSLPHMGLEGAFQPQFSFVDCFVTHLQLAQTLLYELDHISRADSETLWMLRTEISTDTPLRPLLPQYTASATITANQRLDVETDQWRHIDIEGDVAGIRIKCSLGHKLPHALSTHPLERNAL